MTDQEIAVKLDELLLAHSQSSLGLRGAITGLVVYVRAHPDARESRADDALKDALIVIGSLAQACVTPPVEIVPGDGGNISILGQDAEIPYRAPALAAKLRQWKKRG